MAASASQAAIAPLRRVADRGIPVLLVPGNHERSRLLRALGDLTLFVSGFFADSLASRRADLGYYRSLGGLAYGRLAREPKPLGALPDVFAELAQRFMQFADVLSEVSEASRLTSSGSVVRLYERWMQTGSPRAAALLAEHGISPMRGTPESRH